VAFCEPMGRADGGRIRNRRQAARKAGLARRDPRGGQTVAESAMIHMRPEWKECPFVSPRDGRRWPNPQQPAFGQE
jgi:hypothetical protein